MKKKISQSIEGRWYNLPKRGLRVICCDCGGKHVAEFRYYKDKVQYRAFKIIKKTLTL